FMKASTFILFFSERSEFPGQMAYSCFIIAMINIFMHPQIARQDSMVKNINYTLRIYLNNCPQQSIIRHSSTSSEK
ncbi:MAG: hypothetical protein Q8923_20050, partial [Bacillota bacterium]|nr:hypothetical protein [Bacillota bacterium]